MIASCGGGAKILGKRGKSIAAGTKAGKLIK
jgi:hypothetical protein